MDVYIQIIGGNCMTGITHNVDDFSFELISFPFPDSNLHSMLSYKAFYSQLIPFYRLRNNKANFLFRAKLIHWKLINCGYEYNIYANPLWHFVFPIKFAE